MKLGSSIPDLIDEIEKRVIFDVSNLKEVYLFLLKVLNALRLSGNSTKLDDEGALIAGFLLDEDDLLSKVASAMSFVKKKSLEFFE